MERHLQLPDQLSCSVDLATATGKSYVMYGVARIMLAHGVVDRVLVLCPSRTIEKGLTEKFRALSGDAALKALVPEESRVRNPHIINGTESIVDGTICIENFHATLQHVKSSIRDSLAGKGDRTLILNDEVHHVYNPSGRDLKRWKEFLLDPAFGFRYIAGFSGTCYIGDDYFADVIARYSLRHAIEQGFAKTIDYVAEDTSDSQDEKFQKIYDNHIQNKTHSYRKVKPLTILVTRDIAACKRLTADLIEFLARQEGISPEDAAKKVLIVTSAREHEANVRMLEDVDRRDNPIEWITSVSMLTEGWDVQNVFQIVPHEERAFNSKLLIAQVLGRGLRIPEIYKGERSVVTVFNHDAWSSGIKHLVDEVMEIEKRLYSYPVAKSPDYNFVLHQIDYNKIQEVEEFPQTGQYLRQS
jgi:type III restriction enzyme